MLPIKLTFIVLDMPKRPPWKYSMSKEQVERSEQEMFENLMDKIYDEYKLSELSYFERNLEVQFMFKILLILNPLMPHDQLNEIFQVRQEGNIYIQYYGEICLVVIGVLHSM